MGNCIVCDSGHIDEKTSTNYHMIDVKCIDCGEYAFELELYNLLRTGTLTLKKSQRLAMAKQNIIENLGEIKCLWHDQNLAEPFPVKEYSYKNIYDFENIFNHDDKKDELLHTCGLKVKELGAFDYFRFTRKEILRLGIWDKQEFYEWLCYLTSENFIESYEPLESYRTFSLDYNIKMTPKGWAHISQFMKSGIMSKAFIALDFGNPNREKIQSAIEDACALKGIQAFTIDNKEHNNDINDEIISSINSSRVVIADFTKNNRGVYYEAGYARGLGRITILCCSREQFNDKTNPIHFDTNHINHIIWEDFGDLKIKLVKRLGAILN